MQHPAIEVDHLVIRYGDLSAVDGATFAAAAGEVTVVVGPNGAGKSSTVEACEGFRRPSAGSVRVLGLDPLADRARLVTQWGVMLQGGGVQPGLRVGEALRLEAAFHTDPLDPEALADRCGLGPLVRRSWRRLSGGEQQRLLLALALIGRPRVAFLDEPTSGVDLDGRETIRTLVRELADDGVAVLLTTHELAEAEQVADRVVILRHGRVVADGPLDQLRRDADAGVRFRSRPGLDLGSLTSVDVAVRELEGGTYLATGGDPVAVIAAVTAWLRDHGEPMSDLRSGASLEDIYRSLGQVTS